jgi:hypothetical protein
VSPFREPPHAELGPLDVGLENAARIAELRIPSGGRLIAARAGGVSLHAAGAIGSAGFLAVASATLMGWLVGWSPHTALDVLLCVGGVIAGGMSLAAILRAIDRRDPLSTESGVVVGRAARRAVRRLARLARAARTSPATFGSRRIAALRRSLHAARSPEIARWVPADLRGRGALLLARAIAAEAPGRWMGNASQRNEISTLLTRATEDLSDPRPAANDFAVLKRRPAGEAPPARVTPVRLALLEHDDDGEDEDEEMANGGRLFARSPRRARGSVD